MTYIILTVEQVGRRHENRWYVFNDADQVEQFIKNNNLLLDENTQILIPDGADMLLSPQEFLSDYD